MDSCVSSAMKHVSNALALDAVGKTKDAYSAYLQSIQFISHALLQDSAQSLELLATEKSKRLVKLASQCMERVEALLKDRPKTDSIARPAVSMPVVWAAAPEVQSPPPFAPQRLSLPTAGGGTSPPALLGIQRKSVRPSPVEMAKRQNQQMLSAYTARKSRLSHQQATSLSLTLQRRLAENMALAQAREKALDKKIEERRKRLEHEAARRFASTAGMSKDEQERREIYTKILEYEHDVKSLLSWRERLKVASPEDVLVVQELIKYIFSLRDHPLTQLLYKYQYAVYNKACPLIEKFSRLSPDVSTPTKPTGALHYSEAGGNDSGVYGSQTAETAILNAGGSVSEASQASRLSLTCNDTDGHLTPSASPAPTERRELLPDVPKDNHQYGVTSFDDLFVGSTEDLRNEPPSESESQNNERCPDIPRTQQQPDSGDYPSISPYSPTSQTSLSEHAPLRQLDREALWRHLVNIIADVQDFQEKLQVMTIVAYQQLDSAEGRDACYASIEDAFFKSVWGYVVTLFRIVNRSKEQSLNAFLSRQRDSTPDALLVPRKYQLLQDDSLLMPEGYDPYRPAINELASMVTMTSPLFKLESIVRVSRLICKCVEEFFVKSEGTEAPSLGADDLLPILCYVAVKAGQPQIVSECHALEELVHEGYLMGEEGYCLTSLRTALGYLLNEAKADQ